jgi:hypothetical protein
MVVLFGVVLCIKLFFFLGLFLVLLLGKLGGISFYFLFYCLLNQLWVCYFGELKGITMFCCWTNWLCSLINESRGINYVWICCSMNKETSTSSCCWIIGRHQCWETCLRNWQAMNSSITLCFFSFWELEKFLESFNISMFYVFFVCVQSLKARMMFYWQCVWSWWRCFIKCPHPNTMFITLNCWQCVYTIWQHVKCWCLVTCGYRNTSCSLDTSQLYVYMLGGVFVINDGLCMDLVKLQVLWCIVCRF